MWWIRSAIILAAMVATTPVKAEGTPAAGKEVFKKCALCHSPDAGVNKVGPSLHGIIGRHSASVANYSYSPAMKSVDKVWDEKELDHYLVDPRATIPGTKMVFPGLKDEKDRENLIAYLATLK